MRTVMHYIPARRFPTEAFHRAISEAHERGVRVAVGTGHGFGVVPPGYRVAEATRERLVFRGPGADIVRLL